ncbi:hypothetical protein [Sporolactobacillus sp. KGMB 08714]|uniref:hypothetical protein n=1 Tax=Sporolactobacillus sp. KGMB 08714 TaxID=3064704 RepID=UPI002FBD3B99
MQDNDLEDLIWRRAKSYYPNYADSYIQGFVNILKPEIKDNPKLKTDPDIENYIDKNIKRFKDELKNS